MKGKKDKGEAAHDGHHGKKNYILTCDLGSKVRLYRSCGIKTPGPNDPFFVDLQNALREKIGAALPGIQVKAIEMEDLANQILARAHERRNHLRDAIVVSTCPEIVAPAGGYTLQVNRLIDDKGEFLGHGPRPGYQAVEEQALAVRALANDRPIILLEDGTFSGGTLSYILSRFAAQNLKISALVLGFAFPKAEKVLKRMFHGELIILNGIEELLDWMPDHDFFPFIPSCGRVFGVPVRGKNFPFYSFEGTSFSVPYILPFCNRMKDWANIPPEHAFGISLFCLQRSIELFERLEKLNGKEIRVSDLVNGHFNVSVPISIGQNTFPSLEARVIDILNEACIENS